MLLVWAFAGASGALWLLTGGYLLLLTLLARREGRAPASSAAAWPGVAIVVPTRDEEACIDAKLRDLAGLEGAARVMVVDGGSSDATVARVEAAIASGARLELVRVPGAGSKAAQLNHAFARLSEEIVVVTDADVRLEPGCVQALVAHLGSRPDTAIVGALVRPETRLSEERLHWQMVNRLWWLEGEALSSTGLSGVCYAARRAALGRIATDTIAEDVQLAFAAGARGLRVRLCPEAVATELRVPQSSVELLAYRRRRGLGYAQELRRRLPPGAPRLVRLFRYVRRLQFEAAPTLAALVAVLGGCAASAGDVVPVLAVGAAFLVTVAVASRPLPGSGVAPLRLSALPWAAARLAALVWFALTAAPRRPRGREEEVRCSEPVI